MCITVTGQEGTRAFAIKEEEYLNRRTLQR